MSVVNSLFPGRHILVFKNMILVDNFCQYIMRIFNEITMEWKEIDE